MAIGHVLARFVRFLDFLPTRQRVVCTTNALESPNYSSDADRHTTEVLERQLNRPGLRGDRRSRPRAGVTGGEGRRGAVIARQPGHRTHLMTVIRRKTPPPRRSKLREIELAPVHQIAVLEDPGVSSVRNATMPNSSLLVIGRGLDHTLEPLVRAVAEAPQQSSL